MSVVRHSRFALVCAAAGLVAAGLWGALRTRTADPPPDPPGPREGETAARPGPVRQALSNSSCSAAACHGAPADSSLAGQPGGDSWKSSATFWLARDPHSKAYEVLGGAAAAGILKRLRASLPGRWAANAAEEPRCLACHTNPALAGLDAPTRSRRRPLLAEGVGCEACHGNAGGWVYEHPTWAAKDRASGYGALGMARLYDLGERALVCAGCHVGAPADPARGYPVRDLNHDMLAAGHPRLSFDFADSQRRLPPHWYEKDRAEGPCPPRGPGFETKAWLLGRVASGEAACRLLADRAGRGAREEGSPWPEFAESNCFACHHQVLPGGWRKEPAHAAGREPGAPSWQTIWPLTRPEHLAGLAGVAPLKPSVAPAGKGLAAVRDLVQVTGVPRTGPVRDRATAAANALGELRRAIEALPDRAAARVALGVYEAVGEDPFDWDEACQVVQGLAALERTRVRLAPAGRQVPDPAFGPVFEQLTLRRAPRGASFNSPSGYDPAWLKREFRDLLSSVRTECRTVVK
jgi:hypothetical protein